MLLITIDTSGRLATAALNRDGKITEKQNREGFSHLQDIVPMVKALLKEEHIDPKELDAVAVSRGPGSFTGVRIGVVTAKALAQVWDKPVVEVPTLASFAYGDHSWLRKEENVLICPLFDARRSQVYTGVYHPFCKDPVIEDSACSIDELLEKLKTVFAGHDRVVFFGDGVPVYKEKLEALGLAFELAPESDLYQRASSCAVLAAELYKEGAVTDCYGCAPEYLRLAEAERKLQEKK